VFLKLTTQQRQQLIRTHNKLGHPDSQIFGHVLPDQGWDATAIEGIKDTHCPSCVSNIKPKISRPSHLTNPREFNELITIDGVEWTPSQGTQYYFYHILDSGTNFQIAFRSAQRTSSHLIQLINKHWIQWAGPPQRIMTDSAGELNFEVVVMNFPNIFKVRISSLHKFLFKPIGKWESVNVMEPYSRGC